MKTFKHYPNGITCPVCKTNEDKECVLIEIQGTREGYNVEAHPIHVDCLQSLIDKYIYDKENNQLYTRIQL